MMMIMMATMLIMTIIKAFNNRNDSCDGSLNTCSKLQCSTGKSIQLSRSQYCKLLESYKSYIPNLVISNAIMILMIKSMMVR